MTERKYLSMTDRLYDNSLPPEHIHNRIAVMQANRKAEATCECGHPKDSHSYSHMQASSWCSECPKWC